jgi:uncharacterized small protein (DUF1192 family)
MGPEQIARAFELKNRALRLQLGACAACRARARARARRHGCCRRCSRAAEKTIATGLAVKSKRELQERVAVVEHDVERAEKELYAVKADMTRQYKMMEENFIKKISELETRIHGLLDELGAWRPLRAWPGAASARALALTLTLASALCSRGARGVRGDVRGEGRDHPRQGRGDRPAEAAHGRHGERVR